MGVFACGDGVHGKRAGLTESQRPSGGLGEGGDEAFSAGEGFVETLQRGFQGFGFDEVIRSFWGFAERVKAGLDALNLLWDFKLVRDSFLEPTLPAAGFMGDLDGSERAWDGGAFEANSAACDKAIVFVLKPADEAVLGVGAFGWVDLHIAMFCVWCCICSVSSVAEEQPARRHGAVSTLVGKSLNVPVDEFEAQLAGRVTEERATTFCVWFHVFGG